MTKKMKGKSKSTVEKFLENPKQRKLFEKEHKDFLLSELMLAIMVEDQISVRELAKAAGLSPTVIQALRSGKKQNVTLSTVASIAHALGYSAFLTFKRKGEKERILKIKDL